MGPEGIITIKAGDNTGKPTRFTMDKRTSKEKEAQEVTGINVGVVNVAVKPEQPERHPEVKKAQPAHKRLSETAQSPATRQSQPTPPPLLHVGSGGVVAGPGTGVGSGTGIGTGHVGGHANKAGMGKKREVRKPSKRNVAPKTGTASH